MDPLPELEAYDLLCPFRVINCMAHKCMAWRWDEDGETGRCLLIPDYIPGKPPTDAQGHAKKQFGQDTADR